MKYFMKKESIKDWAKAIGYVAATYCVMTGLTHANLDQQITKASDIVLGNLAALMIGGGMVVGGGYSVYQGDIGKGMAQFAVGGIIGIATALAKSKVIFNVLN